MSAAKETLMSIDGNYAAAHVAYALSDVAFIFPITPSSPMGEHADTWCAQNRKNIFGEIVEVTEMQSEAGAAGAVHGGAAAGALVTTYTASQGLLLMVPNMFKIAGELMPVVFHVTARSIAGQALCIFGDHTDVMTCRTTGFAMLCSHSVQEAHDMALVSHMAALKSSLPFMHFFDGFRTSHEIQKIKVIGYDAIKEMISMEDVQRHRERGLNPKQPHLRGTSQGPDVFFQNCEASNKYYDALPGIVAEAFEQFAAKFGRRYGLFDFYGAPDAERVIILMGAGAPIVEEAVDFLLARGEKVGVVKVHLFRPWSAKHFMGCVPKSTKHITVLERTKESGSLGEPLYLDVCSSFTEARADWPTAPVIVGGRYGLGSKDFTPAMAKAVFDNMLQSTPKNHFSVGIEDDVTFLSLPLGTEFDSVPEGTTQCQFWGLGSDGTVGANHDAIKIIGDNTPMFVQGYFSYDAHKSGGVTVSHLRFGKKPIKSQYLIKYADYVACHFTNYVFKYDMLTTLKEGGAFVLNTPWNRAELEEKLPSFMKRMIALKKAKFYTVDAASLADAVGLGRRINMVMQAVFFKLSGVLPYEEAVALLKKAIAKTYGNKGQKIVDMNCRAVDMAIEKMNPIDYPATWANGSDVKPLAPVQLQPAPDFVKDLMWPQLAMEGNNLPVSAFQPGGFQPMGTTKYEKRGIAPTVPVWDSDKCMQCNECALFCPHAAIRPFILTEEEKAKAPFTSIPSKDAAGRFFRIQVSALDCTGCEVCASACVYGALEMKNLGTVSDRESANWDHAMTLPNRGSLFDRTSLIGSQFQEPLLEFSGACEGCNETSYVKLVTQLFGERMIIANATGCSSIWGGTWGTIPYTVNKRGHGPAWGNSLFEDNAEYGLGMAKATQAARLRLFNLVKRALEDASLPADLKKLLSTWHDNWQNSAICEQSFDAIFPILEREKNSENPMLKDLYNHRNYFPRIAQWITGGDGWAYDIGYGGLDHVIAQGVDLNVIVLDTEMYSNTGGQKSKATPMGSVAKFAANGCRRNKKDLGAMAMAYGDIYVASISLQANPQQALKAILEAESYPGASIIICYSPCREQGFPLSQSLAEAKAAVDSGYWNLYRYDPRLIAQGKNPFQLDSATISFELKQFLARENRYELLMRTKKEVATELQDGLQTNITRKMERLRKLAETTTRLQTELPAPATTGVAAAVAPKVEAAPVKRDATKRVPVPIRPAQERNKDFKECVLGYSATDAVEEAKRCLQCKKPMCKENCPAQVPIPEYIGAIQKGDFNTAVATIMTQMPLPGVCGRVCPHNCESKCVRGKKGEPLAIEVLKRAASDFSTVAAPKPAAPTGKSVAVIGSGPAGLSAAYYLASVGHKVTIFEQKAALGGMMTLCIPSYRLPRDSLAADIERIKALGVEMICNSPIGDATHPIQSLLTKDGFNAVFMGCGTLKPKFMGIAGENAKGVEHVVPFLESVNVGKRTAIGKRVCVIGAGYSAMDAVRVARRLGAEASIIYRRQRDQMPASPEEVHEAEEEGVTLQLLLNPTRIMVGANGEVTGVEVQKQQLGAPDKSGRPAPEPIVGSEFVIPCDMVVEAISQEAELAPFASTSIKTSKWNTIEVDQTFATSIPHVWAAGDCVTGPKTIVEAVADAHKAAIVIDNFLKTN